MLVPIPTLSLFTTATTNQTPPYAVYNVEPPDLGGGALPLKGGMGMCRSHDLLYLGQSVLPSLPIPHQYARPLLCPHFQI